MSALPVTADGFYSPLSWTPEQLTGFAHEIDPHGPVDLGIVRAVKILLDAGFSTYESCEGGAGHTFPEPTVRFHGRAATGWRALGVLKIYDLPILSFRRAWDVIEGEPSGPYWEITFRRKLV